MDLSSSTDELVRTIGGMPQELGATACFGTPVEREGHTLIPVARVSFGYGLGFGGGSGSKLSPSGNGSAMGEVGEGGEGGGGGGGGGGQASPVAVIDITRDGVTIEPVHDETRVSLAVFTMAAWIAFWLFWTVRTLARESAKTERHRIEKAGA